jgi:hypothetical protein
MERWKARILLCDTSARRLPPTRRVSLRRRRDRPRPCQTTARIGQITAGWELGTAYARSYAPRSVRTLHRTLQLPVVTRAEPRSRHRWLRGRARAPGSENVSTAWAAGVGLMLFIERVSKPTATSAAAVVTELARAEAWKKERLAQRGLQAPSCQRHVPSSTSTWVIASK